MLGRNFLATMLALGAALKPTMSRVQTSAETKRSLHNVTQHTRSRIAGRAKTAGSKLRKRILSGSITLRGINPNCYGEHLRAHLNKKEFERKQKAKRAKRGPTPVQERSYAVHGSPLMPRTKSA